MLVGTLICWAALGYVVHTIDPLYAGVVGFILFYSSLFLALVGTFSIIGFLLRHFILRDSGIVFRHVRKTFRQSIFLSALFVALLFLLQQELLTWWNGMALAVFYFLLEGIIFTNRKYSNTDYV